MQNNSGTTKLENLEFHFTMTDEHTNERWKKENESSEIFTALFLPFRFCFIIFIRYQFRAIIYLGYNVEQSISIFRKLSTNKEITRRKMGGQEADANHKVEEAKWKRPLWTTAIIDLPIRLLRDADEGKEKRSKIIGHWKYAYVWRKKIRMKYIHT